MIDLEHPASNDLVLGSPFSITGAATCRGDLVSLVNGLPLLIEKARVDADVARLSRLHCQHQQTQFTLRSRVRHFTEDLPRLTV